MSLRRGLHGISDARFDFDSAGVIPPQITMLDVVEVFFITLPLGGR